MKKIAAVLLLVAVAACSSESITGPTDHVPTPNTHVPTPNT